MTQIPTQALTHSKSASFRIRQGRLWGLEKLSLRSTNGICSTRTRNKELPKIFNSLRKICSNSVSMEFTSFKICHCHHRDGKSMPLIANSCHIEIEIENRCHTEMAKWRGQVFSFLEDNCVYIRRNGIRVHRRFRRTDNSTDGDISSISSRVLRASTFQYLGTTRHEYMSVNEERSPLASNGVPKKQL
jgi:hypothetical protein